MLISIEHKTANQESHPFATAVGKLSFEQKQYKEEEYFFRGTANVYEEDEQNGMNVIHEQLPYCNRLLLRRPSDMAGFSGNVIIEILNATAGFDIDRMWVLGAEEIMRDGAVYVGITSKPDVLDVMKKFDPDRYREISWDIPYKRTANTYEYADPVTVPKHQECETGLFWDMLTDIAMLLRSSKTIIPSDRKRYLYLTGWSQSVSYMSTYINYFVNGENERVSFDGYLAAGGVHSVITPLCQDDYGRYNDYKRTMLELMPSPYIAVQTESENAYFMGYEARQEDSDTLPVRYRCYELAGATHDTVYSQIDYYAGDKDMEKINLTPRYIGSNEYPNDFPSQYQMRAVFRILFNWVRHNILPPHGQRIETDSSRENKKDCYGNAVGGIRSPFIDCPVAVYFPYSDVEAGLMDGDRYGLFGHMIPFTAGKLKELYGNLAGYIKQVELSCEEQIAKGFLLKEDREELIRDAAERAAGYGLM